jgi:hypothetical protein
MSCNHHSLDSRGIVNTNPHFTLFISSHLYGVIVWADFVGVWKDGCLGGSLRVQDPVVRYLFVRSCSDSYQVFSPLAMKIIPYKLQRCLSYVVPLLTSSSRDHRW